MSHPKKEGAAMQKQVERLIHRDQRQNNSERQEVWPLSARQFMKLPVLGLLSAGKRLTFARLSAPPGQVV